MSRADGKGSAFDNMSVQLGAIIETTESATNTILKAAESIEENTAKLREEEGPEKVGTLCDGISGQATEIMQACAFQDITGQRVSKIISSLEFVEERVNGMVDIWGREIIEELSAKAKDTGIDSDEPVLEGPQLTGDGISQEEIDALFD